VLPDPVLPGLSINQQFFVPLKTVRCTFRGKVLSQLAAVPPHRREMPILARRL
jgi:hypothetical protein